MSRELFDDAPNISDLVQNAVAKSLAPEPKTVALVGADAEFSNNVLIGARENAKKYNLKIVYDRSYPPATVDYTPIMRAIRSELAAMRDTVRAWRSDTPPWRSRSCAAVTIAVRGLRRS